MTLNSTDSGQAGMTILGIYSIRNYAEEQGSFDMDKSTVLEIIAKFKKALLKNGTKVDKLILYGSFTNGIPHEGSDIDLVVISPDFENKSLWERIKMVSKAIRIVFEPIEAIPMTPAEWERGDSMIVEFAKSGEVVG